MTVQDVAPFGDLLRGYRRAAELTQEALAERAGLSECAVREIEQGVKHTPRKETVHLLGDAVELEGAEREAFQSASRRVGALEVTETHPSSELHTFLIADLRGYTRFTQEQGDEAAAHLTARFAEVVEEEVRPHGGQLLELRGDEAMVVFSSARETIRAAVELQHRFAREWESDPSLPFQVGIGLDTGDVVPVRGGYRGGALNLAAGLCSLAGAGEVFASNVFVHLAGKTEGCVYIDRGEVHLKGMADPVRVIQIAAEGEILPELPPLEQVLVSPPTNLPDEPTLFIGREREIGEITDLLQRPGVRLATLTGTGGTGKSRLALQVAGQLLPQFEDGVFVVPLGSLSDPDLVPSMIAETVGVKERGSGSLMETLVASLKSKRLLLVLDNFEHLLDAAPVVAELLVTCRDLHILVTSRIPLHLSREHQYAVPPLLVPDPDHLPPIEQLAQVEAAALFLERAQAARASFALTEENAPIVAEICSRLDGLPLAIVLAAARIKLFSPQALLDRVSSRLTLLTGGARDLPARQQTLRAAIEWSYDLLTQPEQRFFARLSVFAGGCTLEAAEGVCAANGTMDILEGMTALVEQSLLERQEGRQEPRFQMLETIREYTAEMLEASGEAEALRSRHASYYLSLADEAESKLWGRTQSEWLGRLEEEHDNLRAALTWWLTPGRENAESALHLATALWKFWYEQGYWTEGSRWLRRALAVKGPVSSTVRAKALSTRGTAAVFQGDYEVARASLEEGLDLFRAAGSKHGIASCLTYLGYAAAFERDHPGVRSLLPEALAVRPQLTNPLTIAYLDTFLALAAADQGDLERAMAIGEESLGRFRVLGDSRGVRQCLTSLGLMALGRRDLSRARELFTEDLELSRQSRDVLTAHFCLLGLGCVASLQGDARHGAQLWGAAEGIREAHGLASNSMTRAGTDYERCVRIAHEELGQVAFSEAWEEGRALTVEQAVTYALNEATQA